MVALVHSNWNSIWLELVRWLELSREPTQLGYSTQQD